MMTVQRLSKAEFRIGLAKWAANLRPKEPPDEITQGVWYDIVKGLFPVVYFKAVQYIIEHQYDDDIRYYLTPDKGSFGAMVKKVAIPMQIRYIEAMEAERRKRELPEKRSRTPEELEKFNSDNAKWHKRLKHLSKAKVIL